MLIIGCDFHTRYQQIAMAKEETGELLLERRLDHQSGEANAFYRSLQAPVRVGIEATGPIHWFERLLAELGHELWIGDSARIRASEVRKQKTDQRDAALILDLLLARRFPKIWVPTPGERDFRQLLVHRHKLVCLRTTLGNQLHALAMSQGLCRKKKLFTRKGRVELAGLTLGLWASRRRAELLKLLDQLEPPIAELDRAVLQEAERREDAVLLMPQPETGELSRTESERGISSGGRRRTGAISKQGNTMLRWLLVEAAQRAARCDPALRQDYQRLKFRRGHAVAKVAIARKLAVRMYWMLRSGADYAQLVRRQGSPGATLVDANPSLG